jgi:ribosomal-protein-alanine N-acetyltransferase
LKVKDGLFLISSMTEHDLLEVVDIEESSGLSRWGWEAYHHELLGAAGTIMRVARRTEESSAAPFILGFLAAKICGTELHINNIAVRQDFRLCGIGGALLDEGLKSGARSGGRVALLETRVSNVSARALYRSRGFRDAGVRRSYYSDPMEDALIMKAKIYSSA